MMLSALYLRQYKKLCKKLFSLYNGLGRINLVKTKHKTLVAIGRIVIIRLDTNEPVKNIGDSKRQQKKNTRQF